MVLCQVLGRTAAESECFEGERAGIDTMWVNSAAKVTDITFSTDRQVSTVTSPVDVGAGFQKFEFEKDTAFLSQSKTRTRNGKGGTNVAVQISFNTGGLNTGDLNILENLNQFKQLHVIVLDNNGKYWYAGINFFPASETWSNAGLLTGEGSGNTGTDPVADASLVIETLSCNSNWYCREYVGGVENIPVN